MKTRLCIKVVLFPLELERDGCKISKTSTKDQKSKRMGGLIIHVCPLQNELRISRQNKRLRKLKTRYKGEACSIKYKNFFNKIHTFLKADCL